MTRDIDLDGIPEQLEARGTGKSKQIYVFKTEDSGQIYIGMLTAHPTFYVAVDRDNELVILNVRRMGVNEVYLDRIQYQDRKFVVTGSLLMQ